MKLYDVLLECVVCTAITCCYFELKTTLTCSKF